MADRPASVRQAIRRLRRPIFTTREVAAVRGGGVGTTSRSLAGLEAEGTLLRVARGVWCDPEDPRFTRFGLVPYLSGAHPAYVSLVSALHLHGLIGQIPQVVYAATTGHTARRSTPVGTFSFHRIDPRLFAGFDWYGERSDFLIAEPEKALIDSIYLSSRRGKRFGRFPELDIDDRFDLGKAERWVRRIPDKRIRTFVTRRLRELTGDVV